MNREALPDLDGDDGNDPETSGAQGHDGRTSNRYEGDSDFSGSADGGDFGPERAAQMRDEHLVIAEHDGPDLPDLSDPTDEQTVEERDTGAEDEDGDNLADEEEREEVDDEPGETAAATLAENELELNSLRHDGIEIPQAFDGMANSAELIKDLLGGGLEQKVLEETLGRIDAVRQAEQADLAKRDDTDRSAGIAQLVKSWGGQAAFDANVKRVNALLDGNPGLKAAIFSARSPDGRRIANDPATIQMLLGLAQQQSRRTEPPHPPRQRPATRPPAPAPRQTRDTDRRLAEIERVLKTDADAYYAQGLDQEHLQLLSRRA